MTSGTLAAVDDHLRGHGSLALVLPDGMVLGPDDARARLIVRSPHALRRIVTAPGELGFARAYVAGEIELDGDIYAALPPLLERPSMRKLARLWIAAARTVGVGAFGRSRRRPKKRGLGAVGTRAVATPPPSHTTTTSPMRSTGSSWGRL